MNSRQKGFTLIELLVVATIIAILASIGLVSYRTVNAKNRDVRRIADLDAFQDALEQEFQEDATYIGCAEQSKLLPYLPLGIPRDPKTNIKYVCETGGPDSGTNNNGYCICAQLENEGSGNANGRVGGVGIRCDFDVDADLYCIENLQGF